ncbi:hypothetical protein NYR77_01290 [Actinobacillus equuli subsp. haemolyticus]|uniref:hypothetical protein n=1 Tax=Actinobacillus equuli TaxID=718 RepID=UPI0024435528|nr:hypothetical protein [Actinobacillus equuli]WGE67690.1 hypothetical protein NYR77_01290 [Actinobacillus equuli subsp. haemolyticus]
MPRKIILCPKIFNLYGQKDYQKSIEFLEKIEQSIDEDEIVISFAYCKELKAAAQVVLFARLEMLLATSNVKIILRPSLKNPFVNDILKETGIVSLCEKRTHINIFKRSELLMISSEGKQLIDDVTDFVIEKAYDGKASPEQEQDIGAAISEAHYNVILHAYPNPDTVKRWWLRCSILDDELYLIIYDQGVGISNTFDEDNAKFKEINWVEVFQDFISRLGLNEDVSHLNNQEAYNYFKDNRKSQLIYIAMSDNETGMRGNLTQRHGRGSKSIKALVGKNKNGKLWIFSNNGSYCYTDANTNPELIDYQHSIQGTLIQWNIKL